MNMLTREPAAACEFFGALLGWTFSDMNGMGYVVMVDGQNMGGIFNVDGPNTPPGGRPHIGVMLKVEDTDKTVARIDSLGGRHKPPFDVMQQGRMAVCFDPSGAEFDIWQPINMKGTVVDSTRHGAPSWFSCISSDVVRNEQFYCDLFGWTAVTQQFAQGNYTTFSLAGRPVAGMISVDAIPAHETAVHSHWGTYFTVDNVDAAADTARKLGANISVPLTTIPGFGRFCGLESPQGVPFYMIQYAP